MPAGCAGLSLAAAVAAPLCWSALVLQDAGSPWRWLGRALTSRLSITCQVVLVCSALVLVALCRALWWAGAPHRKADRSVQGAAILEFVLALPIALMLVLIMVQSSLLMGGNLCVHYSAFCAARSAVVYVPADFSPSEPRNCLTDPEWSGKLHRIRQAALWAVMPISCGGSDYPGAARAFPAAAPLRAGIGDFFASHGQVTPGWVDERLDRKWQYAEEHTQVALAPPAAGDAYGDDEDLWVTVRHAFYLSVPYAGWVFRTLDRQDGVDLDFADGQYALMIEATCTLTNEGVQDFVDEERFAAQ